jgi:hypothetical protein
VHGANTAFALSVRPSRAPPITQPDGQQLLGKLVDLELKVANAAMSLTEQVS